MHFDFIRGTQWMSCASDSHSIENAQVPNAALSYVTGSHNVKGGFSWKYGPRRQTTTRNADLMQRYRDGVPDSVQVYTSPDEIAAYLNADIGLYLMDSWTINRLTLSPGIRWNHVNTSHEAKTKLGGRFSKTIITPEIKDQPNWSDWTPRLSGAYDVFGNGKTAVKANVGKYMRYITTSLAQRYSPFAVNTEIRNWNDCAFLPGTSTCDPAQIGAPGYHDDIAQDNEIGPSNVSNFGFRQTQKPGDDLKREYNVEYTVSVQQELLPGVSVLGGWYHRTFHRIMRTDNELVTAADYTPFTTASPIDGSTLTIRVGLR